MASEDGIIEEMIKFVRASYMGSPPPTKAGVILDRLDGGDSE